MHHSSVQSAALQPIRSPRSTDWQGELGTYDYTTVDLLDVTIDSESLFVFEVISEDDNEGNNTTQGSVTASEEVANNLEVRMKTDGAPEQLGWSITDGTGSVVASVLPGSENLNPPQSMCGTSPCLNWVKAP